MKLRRKKHETRRGFTLLEVLLASLIAVFLLGGLYVAFDVTLRQTNEARDGVASSNLSRAVFNKMSLDLASTLSPLPPKSGGNSSSTSSDGSTTSSDGSTMSTDGSTTTATTTDDTTDTSSAASADIPFQAGVIGSQTQLTIFMSRVPLALGDANTFSQVIAQTTDGSTAGSDLLRVTYWLNSSGSGLCRQERQWVTADGIRNSTDPDLSDETGDTIADEVTELSFEYFDGSTGEWLTEWDGSTAGPDGVTPTGPPRAIRVTMTLQIPSSRGEQPTTRTVTQVLPIRTAAGLSTPTLLDTSGTSGSTTSGATTSGSGM